MTIQNLIPNEAGNGSLGLTSTPWGAGVFNEGIFNTSVGIGTTSPDGLLELYKGSGSTGYNHLRLITEAGGGLQIGALSDDANPTWSINTNTDESLVFSGGTNEYMRIQSGNVGIGTTNPICTLHVDSSLDGPIFDSGGTGNSNHALLVRDSASNQLLRVDNNGYVGIGTTSPSALLEVGDGVGSKSIKIKSGGGSSGDLVFDSASNEGMVSYEHTTDSMRFHTSGSEKVRIDSAGNVGIGTTSPAASLTVAQSGTIAGVDLTNACFLAGTATVGIGIDDNEIIKKQGTGGAQLSIGSQGSSASISFKTGANPTNGDIPYERMIIDSDGNVGIGTTSPSTTLHAKKGDSSVKFLQDDKAAITLEAGDLADLHISHDGTTNKMHISHGTVVGSAKLLTINANDGNVGIGATSPESKLHVFGDITFQGETTDNQGTRSRIIHTTGTSAGGAEEENDGGLLFQTYDNADYVDALAVRHDGNVGIGTTSPSARLTLPAGQAIHFDDSSAITKAAINSGAGGTLELQGNLDLRFKTTNEAMRIDSNGNVGIGTTSPGGLLHISSDKSYADPINYRENPLVKIENTANEEPAVLSFVADDSSANNRYGNILFYPNNTAASSYFAINADIQEANHLVIKGDGNVGIGTTTPGAFKLNVAGNAYIGGNLTVSGKTITEEVETVTTSNGVIFEGSAADNNELTLKAGVVTSDRTITLPDKTGTVALTSDIPAPAAEANDLTVAVTWANVPDANITQTSVTQHQAALSITESQISNLGPYLTNYTVTQSDVTQHEAALSVSWSQVTSKPSTFTPASHSLSSHNDVSSTDPGDGQVLKWNGTEWAPAADNSGLGSIADGSVTPAKLSTGGPSWKVDTSSNDLGDMLGIGTVPLNNLHIKGKSGSNTGFLVETDTSNVITLLNDHASAAGGGKYKTILHRQDGSLCFRSTDDSLQNSYDNLEWQKNGRIRIRHDSAGIVLPKPTSTPSSPEEGELYYSTTEKAYFFRDNSSWQKIASGTDTAEASFFDSDESLKDGISEISDATNKLKSIKGVDFTWNESAAKDLVGKKDVGVIAQDIEKVIPEAVKSNDDGILSVQYHKIIPLLIETIKDQEKRISELEKRI